MPNFPSLPAIREEPDELGPAMTALTAHQRRFVLAYFDHPNYSQKQLAMSIGVADRTAASQGCILMQNPRVLAAINEHGHRFLGSLAPLALKTLQSLLRSTDAKVQLKAVDAVLDRVGFHKTTQHNVVVDDKRPQTRQEALEYLKRLVGENQSLDESAKKKLLESEVIEGEFVELDPEVEDL